METSSTAAPIFNCPPLLALLTPLPSSRPPSPLPATFPPPQTDAGEQPETGAMTGELEMRLGLARRILLALQGQRGGRNLLACLVIVLVQLVAWSVVLGVTAGATCDRPLRLYLILTVVRLGLNIPFLIHSAIVPARPNRRDGPEQIAARELTRQVSSMEWDRKIRRVSDLASAFACAVFVLGNIVVNASDTCHATAPVLYRSALAALILSWFWSAGIILTVILTVVALPFLLISVRFFGMGTAKHEIGPLNQQQIDKIPQRVYLGSISTPPDHLPSTPAGEAVSPPLATASPPKRQFWRLWRRPKRRTTSVAAGGDPAAEAGDFVPLPKGMEGVRLPESQDACSICLMEYELPPRVGDPNAAEWEVEPLKVLPCRHAFHAPCLDSWLLVSGRCPLCQAPVLAPKGKKGRSASAAEDEGTAPADPGAMV